jgi:hypothetical protein
MKAYTFVASVLVVSACAAMALAQERADGKKNLFQEYMEKYGPPGPEHKSLEPLVGTWTAKVRCWMDPTQAPVASDGTLVRKSIMGGRFVQEDYDGKMMGRPFQGLGIMGFDRAKKKYVATWLDSVSTSMPQSYGTYDEGSKTWTFRHDDECPITGKHVRMRDTLRIVNADEQEMAMYRQLGDDKEAKVMEIMLTRKK